jgi:small subunit ribosomal protein S8
LAFMNQLVSNVVSHIKNGFLAQKKMICCPYTLFCKQILSVLYKEGYISGFYFSSSRVNVFLKYIFGRPVVSKILSVSKPSKRIYVTVYDLWRLSTSYQTLIISTSLGVLSDKDCRKRHVGGELLYVIL